MYARRLILLCAVFCLASAANAQITYRWQNKATGQTVYSDQPPPPGTVDVVKIMGHVSGDETVVSYATRQAMEKYPVTLYTTAACTNLCQEARDLLNGRGVPFTEKMANSQKELDEAAQKIGGTQIPSLMVGQQAFKGFESGAWSNLLDLAAYPKSAPAGSKPMPALKPVPAKAAPAP